MPRTVSFHLTSQTATRHGDSNFSIPLSPALEIPHTAEATVYLHNLLFDNAIANVSKNLYDNADIQIEYDGHQVNMSFDDGAYSLAVEAKEGSDEMACVEITCRRDVAEK